MPHQAIFGRDMHFDAPYLADWEKMGYHRQMLVDQNNVCENKNWIELYYTVR